jgi:glucokinase
VTEAVVALDVGGSSVKSALVDPASHEVRGLREDPLDSLASAEVVLESFTAILQHALAKAAGSTVVGLGVGFPGPFDYPNGICLIQGGSAEASAISHAGGRAKFESIYGQDLRAEFRARLAQPRLPIVFGNDATVALLGEARYGSGQPYHRLIGVTLGTGLGSAFLVEGAPVTEGAGVPRQGWLYSEPFRGAPADDSFSARGLRQRWQRAGADYRDAKAAAQAAREGEAPARQAFEAFGAELGEFLLPHAARFGAEVVLVMGGLARPFDLFEQPLAGALGRPVLGSRLGPRAALLGAADLLLESLGG